MISDKQNLYNLKQYIPLFLLLTLLGIGVLVATLLSQTSQDTRRSASTGSGTAQINITTEPTYPISTNHQAPITANTAGQNVDGIQLAFTLSGNLPNNFTFTKNQSLTELEVVSATPSGNTYQITLLTTDPNTPFNTYTTSTQIGTFDFNGDTVGSFNLTFDPTLTKIIAHQTSQDILITPGSFTFNLTDPSTTPPVIDPSSGITIQTKLKGITTDVGPITASLRIGKLTNQYQTQTMPVTLTHTNGGIYQTTFIPTTPLSGTDNWISIKAGKHLARTLTNQTLTIGTTIDFTSKTLEPGDLPDQDGVVDDNDLNATLFIFTMPTQTQNDLNKADVNYDGVVNAIDFGLILSTLSTKTDEAPF